MEDKLDRQYIMSRMAQAKMDYRKGLITKQTLRVVCKELLNILHYHTAMNSANQ